MGRVVASVAIFFPAVFGLSLWKAAPVRPRDYVSLGTHGAAPGAEQPARSLDVGENLLAHLCFLVTSAGSGLVIGLVQYGLFRLSSLPANTAVLFEARTTDIIYWSLLLGFFLGFLVGDRLVFFGARRVYGDTFQEWLIAVSPSHRMRVYRGIELGERFVLALALVMPVANFALYNSFVRITRESIDWRSPCALRATSRRIGDIDHAVAYSARRAPGGIVQRPGIRVVFRDGSAVDSSFVIENDRGRLAAFRQALVSASDGRLSLVQTPVRD